MREVSGPSQNLRSRPHARALSDGSHVIGNENDYDLLADESTTSVPKDPKRGQTGAEFHRDELKSTKKARQIDQDEIQVCHTNIADLECRLT
jgi:hypothetical protein